MTTTKTGVMLTPSQSKTKQDPRKKILKDRDWEKGGARKKEKILKKKMLLGGTRKQLEKSHKLYESQ